MYQPGSAALLVAGRHDGGPRRGLSRGSSGRSNAGRGGPGAVQALVYPAGSGARQPTARLVGHDAIGAERPDAEKITATLGFVLRNGCSLAAGSFICGGIIFGFTALFYVGASQWDASFSTVCYAGTDCEDSAKAFISAKPPERAYMSGDVWDFPAGSTNITCCYNQYQKQWENEAPYICGLYTGKLSQRRFDQWTPNKDNVPTCTDEQQAWIEDHAYDTAQWHALAAGLLIILATFGVCVLGCALYGWRDGYKQRQRELARKRPAGGGDSLGAGLLASESDHTREDDGLPTVPSFEPVYLHTRLWRRVTSPCRNRCGCCGESDEARQAAREKQIEAASGL